MAPAWNFQGSNNGSTWTTIDTQTGISWSSVGQIKTFTIASPASYRYYNFTVVGFAGFRAGVGTMYLNTSSFTSGSAGDFYYQTGTYQFYGPRPSGSAPTWPVQALPQYAGVVSSVATFTASGCSNSALVGGATAGTYTSGTTGTCTVVVTMGNTSNAPHGWACAANDLTTPADTIKQTASTATTATLSGTTVSGDAINFQCIGY
jgi:hypothetical protein